MKSSQLLKLLKQDGWYIENQEGSHILMRHPTKPGKLSMPFHASKEVKPGLLHAILKQTGIKTNKR